jgi:hypothetical protein
MRAVGLKLMQKLETLAPTEFVTMWVEYMNKKQQDKKEDEGARTEGAETSE